MYTAPPAMHGAPTATEVAAMPRDHSTQLVVLGAGVAAFVGVGVGLGMGLWVLLGLLGLTSVVVSFRTDTGLLHILALAPFCEVLGVGPLSIGRALAVLAALVLLTRVATGQLQVPGFPTMSWMPALAFTSLVVASGLWATSMSGWAFAMGQVALALVFFAAFALLLRRPSQVAELLRTYVLGSVLAAGVGIFQALTDVRAEGLQGDANIYALYQVAALPAAVALARSAAGVRRWLWLLATLPITASLLASQSRGAIIAFAVTTLTLAAIDARRRLFVPVALGAGVLLGGIALLVDDRYAPSRVSSDRASGRIDIWHTAWQAFLDHPWTGIGAGNYVPQSIERLTVEPGVELIKSHLLTGRGIEVHNIYLEALTERGVFGLLTLVALILTTAYGLFIVARRFQTAAISALFPMLVAYSVAAFFLSVSNSKLLWMLIGLTAALLVMPYQHRHPARSPELAQRSLC